MSETQVKSSPPTIKPTMEIGSYTFSNNRKLSAQSSLDTINSVKAMPKRAFRTKNASLNSSFSNHFFKYSYNFEGKSPSQSFLQTKEQLKEVMANEQSDRYDFLG